MQAIAKIWYGGIKAGNHTLDEVPSLFKSLVAKLLEEDKEVSESK